MASILLPSLKIKLLPMVRAASRVTSVGAGRKLGGDSPGAAGASAAAPAAAADSAEERRRRMAEAADARFKAMGQ